MDEYNDSLVLDSDNRFICEALELFKTSNSGGKFLRGALIALGYQSFKDDDKYIPLGMAFEIFQTSILIHDDIIDMADKRRGVPTIPVRYQSIYMSLERIRMVLSLNRSKRLIQWLCVWVI